MFATGQGWAARERKVERFTNERCSAWRAMVEQGKRILMRALFWRFARRAGGTAESSCGGSMGGLARL